MEKLIVRNSHIAITDYTPGENGDIERMFSYDELITHQRIPCGRYYDPQTNVLYLPRGIDIWWIEKITGLKASIDRDYYDIRYIDEDKPINLLTKPRNDVQKEALRFMVCGGEYARNKDKSQLSLNLNTGKGKTYISVASIVYYQMATILIMYSNSYIAQWKEKILEYTDCTDKDIKIINGSPAINKLFKTHNPKEKIYLVTHSTLHSYGTANGWNKIGDLFRHLGIGLKIYDEAHQNFDNICMIDFYTNVYKTFYVTASPMRSQDKQNQIYALYLKNVPAITLFDDMEDPHTRYIAIKFNSNPTAADIAKCKNSYGLNRIAYMNYLIDKPEYIQLLRVILQLALSNKGKCLIYIGLNQAINFTYNWIRENYPELYNDIGIFTTLSSPEEKELAKDKKIILSTTKSAGAAVDIMGLKMTVVLNEPFKSHVITQQTIGRTRDEDTYYIDCVDVGFKQISRFYAYKQPVVEKYCTDSTLIRLTRNDLEGRANAIIKERGVRQLVSYQEAPVQLVSWN